MAYKDPEKKREANCRWYAANREKKRETDRKRYAANPEKAREANRRWCAANREKKREANRRRRAANPEKARETCRQRRAVNPEKARAAYLKWYAANPDKTRAKAAKRRALKVSQRCTCCTDEQIAEEYTVAQCLKLEVDHIEPLALGGLHCRKNLQVLHPEEHKEKTAQDMAAIAEFKRQRKRGLLVQRFSVIHCNN